MKKTLYFIIFALTLLLTSCIEIKQEEVKIIAPSGTPALALCNFFGKADENIKYEIVAGSDPLVAAFTSGSHDIIVAPVNLGAKFYNTNQAYLLYKTFVWGNTYIASLKEINTFEDLEGKEIVAFGEASTPGIVLKSLLKYFNVNANVSFVDDVSTANASLLTGKAEIILTAEPSLSNLKTKKELYTIDLQTKWMEMTGSYSYPQAGIFVNKEKITDTSVKDVLVKLITSVSDTINNPALSSGAAIKIDETFAKLGKEILTIAIPNCHYQLLESDQEAVEFYLNKLNELGLDKMYGGKLPDEGFYAN